MIKQIKRMDNSYHIPDLVQAFSNEANKFIEITDFKICFEVKNNPGINDQFIVIHSFRCWIRYRG